MILEYELPDGKKKRFRVNNMVAFPWARAICNHPGVAGSVRIIGQRVQVWFHPDGSGDWQYWDDQKTEWSRNIRFNAREVIHVR